VDTQQITGRIFDRLTLHYGRGSVFRDIDSIRPGIDFRDQILAAVAETDLLLAVIGPKWLGRKASRINDEADMVRAELQTALGTCIPIIPVLIDGTKMPAAHQLPENLKAFVFRQAMTVHSGVDFDLHMERLLREIDRILSARPAAMQDSTRAKDRADSGDIDRAAGVDEVADQVAEEASDASTTPTAGPTGKEDSGTELGADVAALGGILPPPESRANQILIEGGYPSPVKLKLAKEPEDAPARESRADNVDRTQNHPDSPSIALAERIRTGEPEPLQRSAKVLIVDDNETNRDILATLLAPQGYELFQAADGEEALAAAKSLLPDLILLDVMMPKVDGVEVCRRLKNDATVPFMPIILVTARGDVKDVAAGLEAGADEYLTKPFDQSALLARVKAALRIKCLHDEVLAQSAELAAYNRLLEQRVAQQLAEIDRMEPLKRFLSPQIVDLVLSSGNEQVLETHRKNITVVFCELRGFTTFAETAAPEEVMTLLAEYHAMLGAVINKYEGTVGRFTGDAVMVLFNDPLPCPDPSIRAVRMANEMRDRATELGAKWRKLGHEIGLGIGITQGYATLGCIGYEGRYDYAAVGTVTNLAARLCSEAKHGQILIDGRVQIAVESAMETELHGDLALKGFARSVRAYIVSLSTSTTT
jgi:class 3 adenylate cyclase